MEADRRTQGDVFIEKKGSIAYVRFYHPAHNSLPGKVLQKLAQSISDCGRDDGVSVIILMSAGDRTFCAGASFDELIAVDNPEGGKDFFMGFAQVINACRTCPRLIIGRVQGKAVGGGVGVAAATDYCFATKYASVKLSELAIGIGPFVVGPAVQRKVGLSAMSQMAIDAKSWYSAEWAKQKGLYTDVFDSAEEMDAAIEKLTQTLAAYNPAAMRELKQIFWEGTEHWDQLLPERAAISGRLVVSEASQAAIAAFKGKG